mgnify:CR=1 FL=1
MILKQMSGDTIYQILVYIKILDFNCFKQFAEIAGVDS